MTNRDRFYKFKPIINFTSKIVSLLPNSLLKYIFNLFKNTPGVLGLFLRYILMKSIFDECGNDVRSYPNVHIYNSQNIKVGSNVTFREMCYVDANGGLEIGDNVMIAHSTSIVTTEHIYKSMELNINEQGITKKKVVIENNVWIGAKATILSGVKIHTGSIVGANAVVTTDVPPNSIVAGIPAKVIKYRN